MKPVYRWYRVVNIGGIARECAICKNAIYNTLANQLSESYDNYISYETDYVDICIDCCPINDHYWYEPISILYDGDLQCDNALFRYIILYNDVFSNTMELVEFLRLVKAGSINV